MATEGLSSPTSTSISSEHMRNSSVLKLLAGLTTDEATLYSAEFSLTVYSTVLIQSREPFDTTTQYEYSLSLCKSPFHDRCVPVVPRPASTPKYIEQKNCHLFSLSGSRIEDSDLPLQIAQAVGRIPGLAHVKFSFKNYKNGNRLSPPLEIDKNDRLLCENRVNALESIEHKDNDHVLKKLELVLEFPFKVDVDVAHEAEKIMTLMLNVGSAVRELSLTIRSKFEVTMPMEHGSLEELHISACDEIGARVVEEALGLNHGPNMLSLGPLRPPLVRQILSPLIPDLNGHQANTCVSTLKLLNISDDKLSGTVELQQERLEEVAKMMKNSTVKLQKSLTSLGNLQSFEFYGKELHKCTSGSGAAGAGTPIINSIFNIFQIENLPSLKQIMAIANMSSV